MAGSSFKIAEGHVEVHADTTKVSGEVEQGIKGASSAGERAGAGVGAKIAAGIGAAVAAAGVTKLITDNLGAGMGASVVAASLGGGTEEAARVGRLAGQLYGDNFGESLEGVQAAIGAVMSSIPGMADANDETVSRMTGKLANLEQVFGVDIPRAAQVAGQLLRTGLAADGDEAADLLTAAMQRVPEAVRGDILDAADEYGPFFAQLGIDGTTAFGLLTTASEQGMYGIDKTGDALKEFTIRSTDLSAATRTAYEALGVDTETMTNRILAGGDSASTAFGEIVHGLQGIKDPGEQAAAAIALFGTPIEDLGVGKIPEFLGAMDPMGDAFDSVAGAADKMGETLTSSAGSKVEASKRQFEQWAMSLANAEGPIGSLAAGAQALGPEVVTAAGAAVTMGSAVLGVVKSAGLAVTALVAKRGAMVADTAATVAADAAAKRSIASTIAMRAAMIAGAVATGVVTAAQWAFNVAVSANPIGLIILAIVALIAGIVALVMNWETVVTFLQGVFAPAIQWIVDVFNAAMLGFRIIGDALATWWSGLWTGIVSWVTETFGPVFEVLGLVFELGVLAFMVAGKVLSDWWSGLWSGIVSWVTETFGPVVQWITNTFSLAVAGFQIIGAALSAWWSGLWQGIAQWAINTFGPGIRAVSAAFEAGKAALLRVGSMLASWWSGLWGGISSKVAEVAGIIGRKIGEVVGFFTGLRDKVWGAVSGFGSMLVSVGRDLVNGLIGGIQEKIGSIGSTIVGGLQDAIAGAKSFLGIRSPSRLMRDEIGKMMGEGLAIGVEAKVSRAEGAGEDLAAAAVRGAQAPEGPASTIASSFGGRQSAGTIIENVTLAVRLDEIGSVQRLLDLFAQLPQAARAAG